MSFSYAGGKEVLKDVSFAIEAGQVAAIVGPSGSGKTTIASFIPRFYDPLSGEVRIDGANVRQYQLKSLRDQINDAALVEHGTKDELLALNGVYADMYRIQNPDDAALAAPAGSIRS